MSIELVMHGAAGRMGQRICALAAADERFQLHAAVDREAGRIAELDLAIADRLPQRPGGVVIDFSHASASAGVIEHCRRHGMQLVIGTTGVAPEEQDRLLAGATDEIAVLWAPNMSVGVNLLFDTAARVAQALGLDYDIEIVEAHHRYKVDAPSGTAYGIADAIGAATGRGRSDLVHGREGHTGERRRGEIGMHALRMGDVVGDHEVSFTGDGERIVLKHVAHNRDVFVRGALRAAAFIAEQKPGRYHMRDVLGL